MEIKEVKITDKNMISKITNFINLYDNIDVKQTIEWGTFRDENKFLLYSENEDQSICMYLNAFEVYDEEIKQNIIYIPRGPVYDKKYCSLEECLNAVCIYFKNNKYKYIVTNPKTSEINLKRLTNKEVQLIDKGDFFKLKESWKDAILDIKGETPETLLKSFHYKTRYNIRRSIKYGVITTVENQIDLEEFYNLYIVTARRHDFTPHSKEYFQKLLKIFKEKLIFGVTKYEDNILAMSINVMQSNTFFYLYGVSSEQHRNKFASYNLHNTMIEYALNKGFSCYSFGGAFCYNDDYMNKDYGLTIFKSRFCTNGFREYIPDIVINVGG